MYMQTYNERLGSTAVDVLKQTKFRFGTIADFHWQQRRLPLAQFAYPECTAMKLAPILLT